MSSAPIKITAACTMERVAQLHRQILPQLAAAQHIVVDLSEMESIDAAGAQMLISIKNSADAHDKTFALINAPDFLPQSLQALGIDHYLQP